MNTKSKIKNLIIWFSVLLGASILFCIYGAHEEKWLWEKTYLEKNPIFTSKYMKKSGKSYTIDNYIITLEKYMYNRECDIGNIVLSIKKKKFETKKDRKKWVKNAEFIFNERFEVCVFSLGGYNPTFVFDKDTLYMYAEIDDKLDYDEKNITPIVVYDKYQEPEKKKDYNFYIKDYYKAYFFPIESNSPARVYETDKNEKLILSPAVVVGTKEGKNYISNNFDDDFKVEVYYKNGKKRKIIDTADKENFSKYGFNGTSSDTDGFYKTQHQFSYALDVDNIDYIKVDGKNIKKYKEK